MRHAISMWVYICSYHDCFKCLQLINLSMADALLSYTSTGIIPESQ